MRVNGQSKTRVLIGLGEFVIKEQTHEWRSKPQSSARANHHYEQSISYFVRDDRYQN